jgi:hypothetical protein
MAGLFFAGIVIGVAHRDRQAGIMSIVKAIGLLFARFVFLIFLQVFNNMLFDRSFPNTKTLGVPPTLQPDSNWSSSEISRHGWAEFHDFSRNFSKINNAPAGT